MDLEPEGVAFQQPSCAKELVAALLSQDRFKYVRCLDVTLTPEELKHVGKAVSSSKFVQSLHLVNNKIGTNGALVLANALKLNDALTTLRVDNNMLGDQSIPLLLQGLRVNSTLAALSLGGNELGCESLVVLAEFLSKNTSIFVLILSNNHIADKGVGALATALEDNTTLRTLRLDNNFIAANGIQSLAKSLEVNTGLRDLSLWSNRFLERSADSLIDTLMVNTTLQSLVCSLSTKSRLQGRIQERLHKNLSLRRNCFLNAQQTDTTAAFGRSKLMVMGKERVGKSATVNSLLGKPFNPKWDSTVGIELNDVIASSWNSWEKHSHGENIRMVVKRAAVESVVKMNTEVAKKQRSSPRRVEEWHQKDTDWFSWEFQIQQQRSMKDETPPRLHMNRPIPEQDATKTKALAGVRSKKTKRETVSLSTVQRQVEYDDNEFRRSGEWSDKVSLSVWDCGGQDVFFNLHQLFMTKYCIYLIVFDATALFLNFDKEIPTLLFWLKYISLYAPQTPTLLVGTHAASLPSEDKTMTLNFKIRRCIGTRYPEVAEFDQMLFHPMDNKTGLGVTQLRKKIDTLASAQPYTKIQVSVRWMCLLEMLLQSGNGWLPFTQVRKLAKSVRIASMQEVMDMLCLFHELGACIFFTNSDKLQSIVTTNPQWLIDSLTKVIKDSERHVLNTAEINKLGLSDDVEMLYSNGLATIDLLQYLWQGERLEFLTDLLRSLLLASRWTLERGEEVYLFPALVRRKPPRVRPNGEKCTLLFSYLPQGVFERLVCLMIEFSYDQEGGVEPEMWAGMAKVYLSRKVAVYLEQTGHSINVYVPKKRCNRYLQVILTLMRTLKEKFSTSYLAWDMQLEQKGSMVPLDQVKQSGSSAWFMKKNETSYDGAIDAFLQSI